MDYYDDDFDDMTKYLPKKISMSKPWKTFEVETKKWSIVRIKSFEELVANTDAFWLDATKRWISQKEMASQLLWLGKVTVTAPKYHSIHKLCSGEKINFVQYLLMTCEANFQSTDTVFLEETLNAEKQKRLLELSTNGCSLDASHIATSADEAIYNVWVEQTRYIANVRFFGELFLIQLVTENRVHEMLEALLKDPDRLSLMALCALLHATGPHLDSNLAKMDDLFEHLQQISETEAVHEDARELLKYYIAWRKNKWIPF